MRKPPSGGGHPVKEQGFPTYDNVEIIMEREDGTDLAISTSEIGAFMIHWEPGKGATLAKLHYTGERQ